MSSDCVFPPRLPSPTEGRQLDPDAQTSTLHHRMPSDAQDAGAFFTGSQNFAISGGSFTSHVHQTLPREVPLDFRTIPLGDIDLQEDLHPDHIDEYRGYLHRRRRRRMYSAKVNGREMTVVMSQADEREKENWVNEVKRINSLRHPSLLQLYGIASSGRTCAAIYHGGVVSMEHLLHHLRADPERRVKLRLKVSCEFGAALNVLNSIGAPFSFVAYFFRTSSGRLCIDVDEILYPSPLSLSKLEQHQLGPLLTEAPWASSPPDLSSVVESLSIPELQAIVSDYPFLQPMSRRKAHELLPLTPTLFCVSSSSPYTALATLQTWVTTKPAQPGETWGMRNADDSDVSVALTQLHNGWIRVSISVGQEAPGKILQFATYGWLSMAESLMISDVWLSQAGHVFSSLNIRENFDSHVIIAPGSLSVEFTVPQTVTLPPGYLFLCPPRRALGNNAQASEEDIAYWSPDPLGRKRLSRDEAYTGGFPNLAISRDVGEFRWDASTYEEIRAVHVAKGFDPDSQDIARHLGYPLFELVSDIKARKRTSFFNEEWKDDGWTLADLFGVEPEFSEARAHPETSESCYERALLKARGILTLCETVVPQVMEGFAILSIALAVWIELSR